MSCLKQVVNEYKEKELEYSLEQDWRLISFRSIKYSYSEYIPIGLLYEPYL